MRTPAKKTIRARLVVQSSHESLAGVVVRAKHRVLETLRASRSREAKLGFELGSLDSQSSALPLHQKGCCGKKNNNKWHKEHWQGNLRQRAELSPRPQL